jgi:hypothetical protein
VYRKGITGLLLLSLTVTLVSQEVSPDAAERVARRFFSDHHPLQSINRIPESLILKSFSEIRNDTLLWYRFDVEAEGFVFVSGDLRCTPIMAYGYQPIDPESTMPEACREWFDWYARQIQRVKRLNLPAGKSVSSLWETYLKYEYSIGEGMLDVGVEPLTVSSWGQRVYYNAQCPEDPDGPGGHAMAGCVATAMAQVLFYYRFPEVGEGANGYMSDYGYEYVDFEEAEYHWDEMVNKIHYWANPEIAQLIYHVGVSVEMNFGPNSSGAMTYEAMDALRNHFRYNPDMNFISKFSLGSAFKDSVTANLDQHRILLYRGGDLGGSHSFVCDGYQDTTYFHFNWGWDGNFNGYYSMENLNPNVYDLTFDQEAVINIYPREDYPPNCQGNNTITAVRGTLEDGSGADPYLPGQACQWLIQPENPAFTNIRIWFTRLDTEAAMDVIRIYDGADNKSPLLGSFSGYIPPAQMESSGNSLFIEFETNGTVPGNGWQMEFFAFNGPFCNPQMQFQSMNTPWMEDGSGPYEYIGNSECGWLLNPQQANTDSINSVDLYFHWFDLAQGDTLFVYTGPDINAPILAELTGSVLPDTVHSTNNKVFLSFRTDESHSGPGWAGGYRSKLPDYCYDTLSYTEKTGILTDGSGDKKYTPNTNCFWHIKTENTEFIYFEFLDFELEFGYDQVRFYDASKTPPSLFATYWGQLLPDPFFWYTDEVLVQFTSDESEQFKGWTLEYKAAAPGVHENNALSKIKLYPNPATDQASLVGIPSGLSPVHIELLDLQCSIVAKKHLQKSTGNTVPLTIQGLPKGIYLVRVTAEESTRVLKLVIQ